MRSTQPPGTGSCADLSEAAQAGSQDRRRPYGVPNETRDFGTYFAPGNDQGPSGARAAPLQTRLIVCERGAAAGL